MTSRLIILPILAIIAAEKAKLSKKIFWCSGPVANDNDSDDDDDDLMTMI